MHKGQYPKGGRVFNFGRAGKFQEVVFRTFDVLFSLIGLLLAAPLFVPIAVLIKLSSRGPFFYPDVRIGKGMKPFRMYKFRTMLESSARIKQSVCPKHDPRVTASGHFLRRTKLNELPQLFNVLIGDMSFVGPRPEAPDLAEMYPEEAKVVFSVKPGLVGPAVISSLRRNVSGRNEEELYPPGVEPKQYYIQHILPEKLKIDLYYLNRQTLISYFTIIISAVKETVLGAFSARQTDHNKRQIYLFIADFVLGLISFTAAYQFYVWSPLAVPSLKIFLGGLLLVVAVRPVLYYLSGLYNLVIELITGRDIYRVFQATSFGSFLMLAFSTLFAKQLYPPILAVGDFCLLSAMLSAARLFLMARFRSYDRMLAADLRPRAFIFGANKEGLTALSTLGGSKNSPYRIVGFIDDAEEKYGKTICGVKVLGNRYHIQALSVLHSVREVILVPDGADREAIDGIVALCVQGGIRTRIFSSGMEGETAGAASYSLRSVHVSDVLPHVRVQLDKPTLRSLLADRTVLMLGSGGKLGSAVCRNIFDSGCRKLVIVDRYESYLRETLAELKSDLPGFQVVPVVVDCEDIEALNRIFTRHRPQIVIHAGMRKFLTLQKTDNDEVARTNYFRTLNLAKLSSVHGCEYFLMISSIKATCRGNFVSESLRVAEISLNALFTRTPTRLIVTRVGNIIENRGGIVSWLNDQILGQGPLRLPAETAKTFLLSKNAAARSILQGLVMGLKIPPGGSLLTTEPGACLVLADVARKIANLYGLKMGEDIAVRFGEIPDGLIDDEPTTVSTASPAAGDQVVDSLESRPDRDSRDLLIEDLVFGNVRHLSEHDWQRWTEEIIFLRDSSLFSQNKRLTVN
jgi:FlaA1/EpsC-like NDP-sugar epimerase/lipopolysaccharide/colanic/teichoic acid biosynthesis glycosyltransferase